MEWCKCRATIYFMDVCFLQGFLFLQQVLMRF